jgi:hypothetical protein
MGIEEIRRLKAEPKKLKVKTPLKKVSDKRQKELTQYSKLSKAFLALHPLCEIKLPGCTVQATEVHHGAGRENGRLLKVEDFVAGCHHCHMIVTEKSKEAIEQGHSYSRLKLNR